LIDLQVKFENDRIKNHIKVKKTYSSDCGIDLYNASDKTLTIEPGKSIQIPAGISVCIPKGYCGFIRARSSTFFKRGLLVTSGTIDSGYIGPLFSFVWHPGFNNNQPVNLSLLFYQFRKLK